MNFAIISLEHLKHNCTQRLRYILNQSSDFELALRKLSSRFPHFNQCSSPESELSDLAEHQLPSSEVVADWPIPGNISSTDSTRLSP
jgi:hypothetical protein